MHDIPVQDAGHLQLGKMIRLRPEDTCIQAERLRHAHDLTDAGPPRRRHEAGAHLLKRPRLPVMLHQHGQAGMRAFKHLRLQDHGDPATSTPHETLHPSLAHERWVSKRRQAGSIQPSNEWRCGKDTRSGPDGTGRSAGQASMARCILASPGVDHCVTSSRRRLPCPSAAGNAMTSQPGRPPRGTSIHGTGAQPAAPSQVDASVCSDAVCHRICVCSIWPRTRTSAATASRLGSSSQAPDGTLAEVTRSQSAAPGLSKTCRRNRGDDEVSNDVSFLFTPRPPRASMEGLQATRDFRPPAASARAGGSA